jgi:hypothetical protein
MDTVIQSGLMKEDRIVAELSHLGVTYLSRISDTVSTVPMEYIQLLAEIVRQPSSRVRSSIIAVLLIHPELAGYIPHSIESLRGKNRSTLKLFYTAAVYLQKEHEPEFSQIQGNKFSRLPDYFGQEFGLSVQLDPDFALIQLAKKHQQITGMQINWMGTYQHVLEHIFQIRTSYDVKYNPAGNS